MTNKNLILSTKPKIGLIACSGENFIEGTITRVATRLVVEKLRPHITTILCQPLFMAGDIKHKGGGKEREFAKIHKTITVEGCEEECAKIAVERFSAPATATIYVKDIMDKHPQLQPKTKENLDEDGLKLAEILANEIALKIDELYNSQ
ncbi:MAG: hypothetical protein FK731_01345 [Asgard group archaeon]|nr:hypothetical protein [Asgard group archaeon]